MFDSESAGVLASLADRFAEGRHLTPSERAELLRIAQGYACKDSANAGNVSPETVRARRKRIYRKIGAAGAGEVISRLLAMALNELGSARVNELPRNEPLASASI